MIEQLPLVARRALALALLALLATGVWWLALEPVMAAYRTNRAAIAAARAELARYQSVAAFEAKLDASATLVDATPLTGQTLPGESDAIALAGLQSLLQTIASSNGAQILSAQALTALEAGRASLVGVRVDMAGELAAIQRTLHKIETQTPFLFVVRANLRAREVAPETAAYETVILDVQLDIYGARAARPATGGAP